MNAAAIAMIISAALRIIQGLQSAFGVSKEKVSELISLAMEENRDVSAAEIEELISSAQAAVDRLKKVSKKDAQ